jgi:hypothetical protein
MLFKLELSMRDRAAILASPIGEQFTNAFRLSGLSLTSPNDVTYDVPAALAWQLSIIGEQTKWAWGGLPSYIAVKLQRVVDAVESTVSIDTRGMPDEDAEEALDAHFIHCSCGE